LIDDIAAERGMGTSLKCYIKYHILRRTKLQKQGSNSKAWPQGHPSKVIWVAYYRHVPKKLFISINLHASRLLKSSLEVVKEKNMMKGPVTLK